MWTSMTTHDQPLFSYHHPWPLIILTLPPTTTHDLLVFHLHHSQIRTLLKSLHFHLQTNQVISLEAARKRWIACIGASPTPSILPSPSLNLQTIQAPLPFRQSPCWFFVTPLLKLRFSMKPKILKSFSSFTRILSFKNN